MKKLNLLLVLFAHGINWVKAKLFVLTKSILFIPFPNNIYVVPDKKCNSHCITCLSWLSKDKNMPWAVWKKTINELSNIFLYSKINISGGEIFYSNLLKKISYYSAKKLFYTGIVSNGFLIDKKQAKNLILKNFSNINISIDGVNEKTVNMIRGRSYAFEKSWGAIKLLIQERNKLKARTKLIVKTIIMGLNIEELPELVKKVKLIGADGIYFQPIEPIYYSNQTFDELKKTALWVKNKTRALSSIDKLIALKKNGHAILNDFNTLEMFKQYFGLIKENSLSKKIRKSSCDIDTSNLFIFQNGDITFCPFFPSLGNIKSHKIKEIITSKMADIQRNKIRKCLKINTCLSTCRGSKSLTQQIKLFFFINHLF